MSQDTDTYAKVQNAIVALGGNMASEYGNPVQTIRKARDTLYERIGGVVACSELYQTPSFPEGSGPDFCNAVIRLETTLEPNELLSCLNEIEQEFGRKRIGRWGARTLDLDLIAYGSCILPDEATWAHWKELPIEAQKRETPTELILPHPRLQDRAFVLVPLCDVAPDWEHPILEKTATELLDALPESDLAEICPV